MELPVFPLDSWDARELFCWDLPSSPQSGLGTVLVTGASGYVGGRLVPELMARGHTVRVMIRKDLPQYRERWPQAQIAVADALNIQELRNALEGIDTAYYLMHSLLKGPKEFELADLRAAINFRIAAEENKIKRIIYLGGLGDQKHFLSPHLQSRITVAKELERGEVPVTILRAGIIIGSGSASYEIIKHLVKNVPVFFIPGWARTECQPIGIRDVIKYLVGVLELAETSGKSYDIGGSDILAYEMMLKSMAELYGKKRLFLSFPFSMLGFFAYLASLLSPVPAPITLCLMEGVKNQVICHNNAIKSVLPFEPITYREALLRAMSREEQDRVYTRWSDAYPPAHDLAIKLSELEETPRYTSASSLITEKKASSLFYSICKIGGKEGWFHNNWMWRLRGILDRILMGVGTSRGRKTMSSLRINDVIGFWRVEDLKRDKSLLLRAEMKLPGRAWLEFSIDKKNHNNRLSVKGHYQPQGLFGKIYWYVFLPFHRIIFNDLIKQIEGRS